MNEPLYGAINAAGFKEDMSSLHIVSSKGQRVAKGVVDVGLGGKVHNGVDGVYVQDIGDEVRFQYVSLHKNVSWVIIKLLQVVGVGAVVEFIKVYNKNVVKSG